uniref:hypothetical protein n=1 Tax=Escherichia coli TaxID=562 RepID=UPI001BD087A3
LQGKISSDGCLKKEQMVVSAIASTPQCSAGDGQICAAPVIAGACRSLCEVCQFVNVMLFTLQDKDVRVIYRLTAEIQQQ